MFKDVLKIHKYKFPDGVQLEGISIDINGQRFVNYLEAMNKIDEYKSKYGSVKGIDDYSDMRTTSLSVQRDQFS